VSDGARDNVGIDARGEDREVVGGSSPFELLIVVRKGLRPEATGGYWWAGRSPGSICMMDGVKLLSLGVVNEYFSSKTEDSGFLMEGECLCQLTEPAIVAEGVFIFRVTGD